MIENLNKNISNVKQTEAKFNIGCLKTLCKDFYSLNLLRKSKIFRNSFKEVLKEQIQVPVMQEPKNEEILIRTIKQKKKKFASNRSNDDELNQTIRNFMNQSVR